MFIDQAELQTVLRNSLQESNVTQYFQTEIEGLQNTDRGGPLQITLNSQEQIDTEMLVVAEGGSSKVANILKAKTIGWSHRQRAIVVNLEW